MRHHFVIDTSVYLNYAFYNKIHRIEEAVRRYGLMVFINDDMVSELRRNLNKVHKSNPNSASEILDIILNFTIKQDTIPIFQNSPDPKDNFLFDLALQTQSEVIVTKEKALLEFAESPVYIRDIKWFKETFPVTL